MGVSSNGHNKVPQSNEQRLAIVTDTPEVAAQLKVGSQWFLVGWFTCMLLPGVSSFFIFSGQERRPVEPVLTIRLIVIDPGFMWTMKLSMLFLMKRLTQSTPVGKFILPIMAYTVVSYIIHAIIVLTYCAPFHKYWQIYPDPGEKCYPDTPVLYIECLIFNVSTDLLIAALPIPVRCESTSDCESVGYM